MIYVGYGDQEFERLKKIGFASEIAFNTSQIISGQLPNGQPLFKSSTHNAFNLLNSKNPGQWSIAGSDQPVFEKYEVVDPNTLVFELLEKIPFPINDTDPFELLAFNAEHRSELMNFRSVIGSMALRISEAKKPEFVRAIVQDELNVTLEKIHEKMEQRNIKSFMSNLSIGLAIPPVLIEALILSFGGPPLLGTAIGSSVNVGFSYSPFASTQKIIPADFAYLQDAIDEFGSTERVKGRKLGAKLKQKLLSTSV